MKTVGIIAEYNPFHTGHAYHIRKAKELTGSDLAVVIMSPDFVQRGEPAVFDKYARAEMALLCGADLVLELPVCYATGSAEYFAEGAVTMLDKLGVIDVLCFGAETDNPVLFEQTARILAEEPEEYRNVLQDGLKNGLTFPQARSRALAEYFSQTGSPSWNDGESFTDTNSVQPVLAADLIQFLETPNNILGIEYCKALYKRKSRIVPFPLKRTGSDYNSSRMDGHFCSATALRNTISDNSIIEYQTDGKYGHGQLSKRYHLNESAWERITRYIPETCQNLFRNKCTMPIYSEDFLPYIIQILLYSGSDTLAEILDISPDLADRVSRLRFQCMGKTYSEMTALLKTRQITEARIRRALLHLLLDIRTEEVEKFRDEGTIFYSRMLVFNRNTASSLLHEIKKRSMVPLISKTADASKMLKGCALQMWEQDLYASHLYRSVQTNVFGVSFKTEYECSPVIILK